MVRAKAKVSDTTVAKVTCKTSTPIHLPTSLSTASGLIKFKYEKHDIQAAFSGGAVDLRNTLAVGTKIRVPNFWKGDHLRFSQMIFFVHNLLTFLCSISVVKHGINPDLTQDVDFKVVPNFLNFAWCCSNASPKGGVGQGGRRHGLCPRRWQLLHTQGLTILSEKRKSCRLWPGLNLQNQCMMF